MHKDHNFCAAVSLWKLGLHIKVYFTLKHFCYLKLATHFMRSKKLTNKKQKISSKNKKDLGMACHIPPLKKAKKPGEMSLLSLGLDSLLFWGMEFFASCRSLNAHGNAFFNDAKLQKPFHCCSHISTINEVNRIAIRWVIKGHQWQILPVTHQFAVFVTDIFVLLTELQY